MAQSNDVMVGRKDMACSVFSVYKIHVLYGPCLCWRGREWKRTATLEKYLAGR